VAKAPSPSSQLIPKLLHGTLKALQAADGELHIQALITTLEDMLTLDDWARHIYPKTGSMRWKDILQYNSVGLVKANFIIKRKGVWYLTPEGEAALKQSPQELMATINTAYKQWKNSNQDISPEELANTPEPTIDELDTDTTTRQLQEASLQEIEQRAADGIRQRIFSLNPYEFQDLVAALLRGMGYHTPFIAPKGKDGGIDVIAYQDPLGAVTPRIKVQIKHRPETKASVQELRELIGLLGREGDVGLFVSSGGFTPDARAQARTSHVHVELIDLDRFITLWQEFYPRLTDEDQEHLRLRPIFVYDPGL
jgi:restriction system protein